MSDDSPKAPRYLCCSSHVSGFDTGDCVGSCRALGFAVNDDAPPRALTLRSLVREGCFAFLMLVRILPLGTKHHTIFGCERSEAARKREVGTSRHSSLQRDMKDYWWRN